MKLAILMSLASPWARETAIRLAPSFPELHVIDFADQADPNNYLSTDDSALGADVSAFRQAVSGIHLIHTRFPSGLRYLASARTLAATLNSLGADVLLTLYGGGFAAMAYLSRFRPYAVYVVGSDVLMATGPRRILAGLALKSAGAVFANGRHLGERASILAPGARIHPIYMGVDTGKYSPAEHAQSPIRIVCTRGFAPVYDNETIIRALRLLPADLPEYHVTFVSKGPKLADARRLADDVLPSEIRKRVEFLGGVSGDVLVSTLKEAHIYVSASLSDGTSISLLEALACGLFPVLSDLPQNREWIGESMENGLLFPAGDPPALAKALAKALSGADLRLKARGYNRQMVVERADNHRNMASLAVTLKEIAGNRPGGRC